MKKIAISVFLLIVALSAAGCGQKPQAQPAGNGSTGQVTAGTNTEDANNTATNEGSQSEGEPTAPGEATNVPVTIKMNVFLTDDDLQQLHKGEREISYTDERSKYEEAFKALQTAEPGRVSLWEKVILNSVQFADGEVTIDITLPDEARLGAGGESMAIEALTQTYFQFDEVQRLELTVDGEKLESLMGHVLLEHPFTK